MNIKTLILSSILAISNVFAAGQSTLTAANLEAYNHGYSASLNSRDSDQASNPSTVAPRKEASRDVPTIARIEATARLADVDPLGIMFAEYTFKHGALIAMDAGLTKLTISMANRLLQKKN